MRNDKPPTASKERRRLAVLCKVKKKKQAHIISKCELINHSVFNFNYKNKINLICKQLGYYITYRNCHKQFTNI